MRRLFVYWNFRPTNFFQFCSDLRCRGSLQELRLSDANLDTAAAMSAVVDASIALRLSVLRLHHCHVLPATLPELTRLIASGSLRELFVANDHVRMFNNADHETTRLFCAAVRASALKYLYIRRAGSKGVGIPEAVKEALAYIGARRRMASRKASFLENDHVIAPLLSCPIHSQKLAAAVPLVGCRPVQRAMLLGAVRHGLAG